MQGSARWESKSNMNDVSQVLIQCCQGWLTFCRLRSLHKGGRRVCLLLLSFHENGCFATPGALEVWSDCEQPRREDLEMLWKERVKGDNIGKQHPAVSAHDLWRGALGNGSLSPDAFARREWTTNVTRVLQTTSALKYCWWGMRHRVMHVRVCDIDAGDSCWQLLSVVVRVHRTNMHVTRVNLDELLRIVPRVYPRWLRMTNVDVVCEVCASTRNGSVPVHLALWCVYMYIIYNKGWPEGLAPYWSPRLWLMWWLGSKLVPVTRALRVKNEPACETICFKY